MDREGEEGDERETETQRQTDRQTDRQRASDVEDKCDLFVSSSPIMKQ